jgi:hypothetical protein
MNHRRAMIDQGTYGPRFTIAPAIMATSWQRDEEMTATRGTLPCASLLCDLQWALATTSGPEYAPGAGAIAPFGRPRHHAAGVKAEEANALPAAAGRPR